MSPKQRRVRGEGSIYRRESDGRWCYTLDLGWVGGRRVRPTVTAPSRKELAPKIEELRARVHKGVLPEQATVEQWLTHWLDDVAPARVKPRTLDTYRGYARTWLIPYLGRRKLSALRPDHVRALHRAMEDAGKSSATIRQAHMILQRALTVAVHEQRLVSNPAALVDRPAVGQGSHGVLPREDVAALLDLLRAYGDDGAWWLVSRYLVALLLGLRQGEALGLRWSDIDWTPGQESILLVRQVQRQKGRGLVEAPLKTKRTTREGRWVPLLPVVVEALARHRVDSSGRGYVWGGEKPTDPRVDWAVWKGLMWSAGLEPHTLHAARATTASLLAEANVPLKTIAEILGHSQITTAWTHYVHTDERQKREGLEAGWKMLSARLESSD